mmetsp:Transcript_40010/g.110145  ORF Transcript_40010/g.110145 Transcript_40010/m.110145 type:complete len:255 (+) Transcript_40010:1070-1834(+)
MGKAAAASSPSIATAKAAVLAMRTTVRFPLAASTATSPLPSCSDAKPKSRFAWSHALKRSATTKASQQSLDNCLRSRVRLQRSCKLSPPRAAPDVTLPAIARPMPKGGSKNVVGTAATIKPALTVVPRFARNHWPVHDASSPRRALKVSRCTPMRACAAAHSLRVMTSTYSSMLAQTIDGAASFAATKVTGSPSEGGLDSSSSQHSHSSGSPCLAAFHARLTKHRCIGPFSSKTASMGSEKCPAPTRKHTISVV